MDNENDPYGFGLTPRGAMEGVRDRLVKRRKERKWSQLELARRSGVSYGTLKHFERFSEISLYHLVKLAFTLDCLEDFETLFSKKSYRTMEELLRERNIEG